MNPRIKDRVMKELSKEVKLHCKSGMRFPDVIALKFINKSITLTEKLVKEDIRQIIKKFDKDFITTMRHMINIPIKHRAEIRKEFMDRIDDLLKSLKEGG